MATKGMDRLLKELAGLGKRALNQKVAWKVVGGMVFRRFAVEWFRGALGLRKSGGGPRDNPWRALTSEPYIKRKLKKRKTKKLVYTGTLRTSYFFEAANDHCIVGNRDFEKAGWLEKMGFEVLALENDISNKTEEIITNYIWTGKRR